jgi:hypothetical protein
MWTLRLLARVPATKTQEFLDAARGVARDGVGSRTRRYLLKAVELDDLYCCMADGEGREQLAELLGSAGFTALVGATRVLGTLLALNVATADHPPPAVGPAAYRRRITPPSYSVRMIARIPPDRREQFTAEAAALLRGSIWAGDALVLEGLDQPDLAWVTFELRSAVALDGLLVSGVFKALDEAARSGGQLESTSVAESRSLLDA